MKKILDGFEHKMQPTEKSCWIACATMMIYYISKLDISVTGVASVYNLNLNSIGSPIEVLLRAYKKLYVSRDMPMDNYAIPTFKEIRDEIMGEGEFRQPRPLLCCVGDKEPNSSDADEFGRAFGDSLYKNGHWILIIGIDEENNQICISDPEIIRPIWVMWDAKRYLRHSKDLFWQSTTYFNF